MGCGASAESGGNGKADKNTYSVKTIFGKPNLSLIADVEKHRVRVRPAFMKQELGTLYLLSTTIEDSRAPKKVAETQKNTLQATAASKPEEAAAPSKPEEAAAPSKPEEAAAPSKPEEATRLETDKPKPDRVRWGIYNDSASEAKVTSTFFHAEEIVTLCKEVEEERLDNGKLRAIITVPAGKTMLYVEGPISGYLWKCEMKNTKGAYEGTYALELKKD